MIRFQYIRNSLPTIQAKKKSAVLPMKEFKSLLEEVRKVDRHSPI
jgi:hypothetical protein